MHPCCRSAAPCCTICIPACHGIGTAFVVLALLRQDWLQPGRRSSNGSPIAPASRMGG
ncbi:hypothetical protein BDN71DRAFT_1288107 [Pleurotus eryngii]|uniref:Uncharacterized protein n=1 Tax=Pleurotus eryngii TaxID=5323 RepID=A0A9P6DCG1_PLEER|nr:hypothetical protein BDN71DRAFT_1288107 [Pleurotus eryngii]